MTGSDFFAKRATRRQSPTDASSSPLPKLPVSSSLVAVVPRAIIRSPRPQRRKYVVSGPKRVLQHNRGEQRTSGQTLAKSAFGPIVLQNSKNGLQRFFREMSNQTTIADRFVLKRATEVAGEFINSCCGPPHDYSIAALTARKICLQWSKKSFATLSLGERTSRNAVGMSI